MSETLNIYQKLAALREQVEVIQRNKDGYGYKYVSEDEIMSKISVGMKQYGLSLIPDITPGTMSVRELRYDKTKFTKSGVQYDEHVVEHVVGADMTYTWVNNENPEERVRVNWAMIGQQSDASQAFGSGLSYTARYFLLKYFNVATPNDDPDEFRRKQKVAEDEANKRILDGMIEQIDATVKKAIDDGKISGKQAQKFMIDSGVDSGNYFKIKEQALAAKVLTGLQAMLEEAKGA